MKRIKPIIITISILGLIGIYSSVNARPARGFMKNHTTNIVDDNNTDDMNLGWLGVLGFIGLAGLTKKKNTEELVYGLPRYMGKRK